MGTLALGCCVAFAPACGRGDAASRPQLAAHEPRRQLAATTDREATTIVDVGREPRRALEYTLKQGQRDNFRLSQELSIIESNHPVGSVVLQAPLEVHVLSAERKRYALRLKLGPAKLSRVGDSEGIEFAQDVEAMGSAKPATLDVLVDARGRMLAPPGMASAKLGSWQPIVETVIGLARLPGAELGLGGRWQSRLEAADGARTLSRYELLAVDDEEARLRVWRTQSSEAPEPRDTRSMGEWVLHRQRWPMTGADRISLSVPQTASKLLSVSFKIERVGWQ